ncbi:Ppx/GppA phosphatase family protein [Berryella wangjianweii]|nr:Ppx/GppA family phosphatase [Berryella wangjianweii]
MIAASPGPDFMPASAPASVASGSAPTPVSGSASAAPAPSAHAAASPADALTAGASDAPVRGALCAAIDIGTVTARMLVALMGCDGSIHELARGYRICNLGQGVDATGVLRSDALDRVGRALEDFRSDLASFERSLGQRAAVRAIATSAARDARNASQLIELVRSLGIELQVASGHEEAGLCFAGVAHGFPDEALVVIDIGGGSTEVVAGTSASGVLSARSFDIGCRRATEKLLGEEAPCPADIERLRCWVREQMAPHFADLRARGLLDARLVGVAGTATTVVSVRERMREYRSDLVHGAEVTRSELRAITDRLAGLSLERRREVVGLDPQRAGVIVAGLVIMEECMTLAGAPRYTVSESDVLQGIILAVASQ